MVALAGRCYTPVVPSDPRIITCTSLRPELVREILSLMEAAFDGDFAPEDWAHALGGTHALAFVEGSIVAHASVVPRPLWVAGRKLRACYVEAVAVLPSEQGRGYGSAVMRALCPEIARYELGALSTGEHRFYERLGWERWRGATWVRSSTGRARTADEDDGIMILRTDSTPDLSIDSDIECEPRPGDDW
ncbi:MAG: GNAT family N-acetyltransferase [Spirochaetaceae bacterium]|nr:MAG: GNAT family N-acetyltransferase [Spirochaetaceae bacterium]